MKLFLDYAMSGFWRHELRNTVTPPAEPRRGGARAGGGRPTADGASGMLRKNVSLDQASIDALRTLGDGDLSLGIRRAASRSA